MKITARAQLIDAAAAAGISVLENPDHYQNVQYPHWAVLCGVHLERNLADETAHFHNAEIIVRIAREVVENVTLKDLVSRGCVLS